MKTEHDEYLPVGCDTVRSGRGLPMFQRNVLLACLAHASTLKMGAELSSDTLVNFYQARRRHGPGDSTLHCHNCEKLKFHKINIS
jgi:hypothetical protein